MSEKNGGGGGSFEDRLRVARNRQGMDAAPPPSGVGSASAMGIGLRAGVELVSSLVVATAIGWGLDRWLHTLPLFLVIFVLLGGAAGVLNVWRLMAPPEANR